LVIADFGAPIPIGAPRWAFQDKAHPLIDRETKIRLEIDDIKAQAAARRLDRIAADLATLKETNAEEYERLAATLREALKVA
jgi:hypothetical protein